MKKLINDPHDVVADALLGIEAAHPELRVDHEQQDHLPRRRTRAGQGRPDLRRRLRATSRCTAASSASACSTPPAPVRCSPRRCPTRCSRPPSCVDGGAGVLHIVKNYTGDVMNFEMAAELAAAETGVEVVSVVTDDDVAVQDSTWTAGRRGVGVTVLLEKIVGAAAEEGRDLDAGRRPRPQGQRATGRSMGMALTSCTVPAAGKPTFDLAEDEMEIGVGIHGEPGRERRAARHRRRRSPSMLRRADPGRPALHGGRRACIAFVNGMGGTPLIELYLMYNEVQQDPRQARRQRRPLPGRHLHHVARHGRLLGHPAQGRRRAAPPVGRSGQHPGTAVGSLTDGRRRRPRRPLERVGARVRRRSSPSNRDYLTELDSAIGDADHGANMDRGMTAAVAALDDDARRRRPARCSSKVGMTLVSTVGGASGPLYGTFFLRMGTALRATSTRSTPDARRGAAGRARGRRGPRQGRARRQDDVRRAGTRPRRARRRRRRAASTSATALTRGRGRRRGRAATRPSPMLARKGRASYLGERSVGHQDPGATTSRCCCSRGRRRADADLDERGMTDSGHESGIVVVSHSRALAPTPRSRWPREMVHGRRLRIEVAAGLDEHDLRHRRRRDQGGHRARRRARRRRRPDGPRQRRAQRRAGPRPARRPDDPRPGRPLAGADRRGPSSPRSPPPAARAAAEVAAEARGALMARRRTCSAPTRPATADSRGSVAARRSSASSPWTTRTACTPARRPGWSARSAASTPTVPLRNLTTGGPARCRPPA